MTVFTVSITLYIDIFRCVQMYNKDQSGVSILHKLEAVEY